MRFANVSITASGYHLPEQILTSQEIEEQLSPIYERLGVPQGRLFELTGIKERRIGGPDDRASDFATQAGKNLFEKAHVDPAEIDLLIHTGVCRDYLEPSTASVIHHHLELSPHCMVFDLSNACIGFLNGMSVAASMIEQGSIKRAMVVTGENSGPVYDSSIKHILESKSEKVFRASLASLTLGSAGVAFLLEREDLALQGHPLIGGSGQADSKSYKLCRGSGDYINGFHMETDTYNLMVEGLKLSSVSWELFKSELQWKNETPDHFITHQISSAHQNKVFEILKVDARKGYSDISWLGNTGSAAAPLSMVLREQEKAIKKGDRVALLGIGSGLNTMMLGVEW